MWLLQSNIQIGAASISSYKCILLFQKVFLEEAVWLVIIRSMIIMLAFLKGKKVFCKSQSLEFQPIPRKRFRFFYFGTAFHNIFLFYVKLIHFTAFFFFGGSWANVLPRGWLLIKEPVWILLWQTCISIQFLHSAVKGKKKYKKKVLLHVFINCFQFSQWYLTKTCVLLCSHIWNIPGAKQ